MVNQITVMKYESIFLSDIHIGTKSSQIKKVNEFLKDNDFNKLFLVGDILDMTNMKHKIYWNNESTKFIRKILKLSRDKEIYYIIGNHA